MTLFHQDMPGIVMYLLEAGHVRVFSVGLSGQEHTLNTFGPGDIFGELALLDGKTRSASAIAMTDIWVWMLSKTDLDDLILRYPTLARAVIVMLSSCVRTVASHVEAIIFQDVLGRVAFALLNLAQNHGSEGSAGIQIDIPLNQTDLASIVGSTRESVNKSLALLRSQG